MKISGFRSGWVAAALCGLGVVASAHAAERIALSNGFDLICNHHALVDGRVRAYSNASEKDFIELNPETIAAVETIPDPPAETIAAFQAMDARLRTGKWQNVSSAQLDAAATALGPIYNVLDINGSLVNTAPQFLTYQPLQFLRPYDAFTH